MAILNTTNIKTDITQTGEPASNADQVTPTRKSRERSGVTVSVMAKKAKDEAPQRLPKPTSSSRS